RHDRLARALPLGQQARDEPIRQPRLIAERHERRRRPRPERRRAHGDRRPLPGLRPRIHREAHREPCQRRAHRLIVLPRHHDGIPHVRQDRLHAPPHDRLAAELKQELLAPHTAREAGGKDDSGDHEMKTAARREGGDPSRRAAANRSGVAQPCARLSAASSARRAKTRQRCALYSTEPCRSACTSTPSAAFWAAASMVAASSFLFRSAASTPLARTALVPAPVTPTPTFVQLPVFLSMVTAAHTPTMAKREAGCGNFM